MSQPATLPSLPDIPTDPSASSQSTNDRRPSQIESYGVHCQESTCNLGDFLPFKCGYCKLSYCSYHRLPFSHSCSKYDENLLDNRVTLCQWCEEPLRVDMLNGRETDINTAMEWHISNNQCKVLKDINKDGLFRENNNGNNGRINKGSNTSHTPLSSSNNVNNLKNEKKCTFGKCKNIMWVEIKCPTCNQKFCPSHRDKKGHKCGEEKKNQSSSGFNSSSSSSNHPTSYRASITNTNPQHQQNSKLSSSSSPNFTSAPFMKTNLSSSSGNTNTGSPSMGGISPKSSPLIPQNPFSKLSLSTSKNTSNPSKPNQSSSTTSSSSTNVIQAIKGKTTSNVNNMSSSRRAAREREQAALALENRAKKGLLTEDEKLRYATLQALEAQQGNNNKSSGKDKDCCIQ